MGCKVTLALPGSQTRSRANLGNEVSDIGTRILPCEQKGEKRLEAIRLSFRILRKRDLQGRKAGWGRKLAIVS